MYNRYIRNDRGTYTRVPEEEPRAAPPPDGPPPRRPEPPPRAGGQNAQEPPPPPPRFEDGVTGFLRKTLDRFHLESVDTGDLLLAVLFLLFEEDADDELLAALGLLLIL